MNDLIPLDQHTIDGELVQTVDARDLHTFLGSKQDFSTWIKNRIGHYRFQEGLDFVTFHKKMDRENQALSGWKQAIDYHLTLDMAKQLAMVERSEKGRQIRLYFIQCEKIAKAAQSQFDLRQVANDALTAAEHLSGENAILQVRSRNLLKDLNQSRQGAIVQRQTDSQRIRNLEQLCFEDAISIYQAADRLHMTGFDLLKLLRQLGWLVYQEQEYRHWGRHEMVSAKAIDGLLMVQRFNPSALEMGKMSYEHRLTSRGVSELARLLLQQA